MSAQKHFLHVFSTFVPAGPELRSAGLMVRLGRDYRHTVIACDGRTDTADLIRNEVDLALIPLKPKSGVFGNARALRRMIDQQEPDLLLSYDWGSMDATFAAQLARFRHHIHHEDGFGPDEVSALKRRRNLARRIALRETEIVVPSRRLQNIAKSVWKLHNVTLIPNGIHLQRFTRSASIRTALRRKYGIPDNAFVVGTVAHLRKVKRLDRVIRAIALVPPEALDGRPLFLFLVGDGDERQSLEDLAQAHAPHSGGVIFAGHLADPSPAYSVMDVLALSSATEQQPISVLEAMAASLPVIATDVGDMRQMVSENSTHLLIDPALPDDQIEQGLANGFAAVLSDSHCRDSISRASLAKVTERYSFDAMFNSYNDLFQRTMA